MLDRSLEADIHRISVIDIEDQEEIRGEEDFKVLSEKEMENLMVGLSLWIYVSTLHVPFGQCFVVNSVLLPSIFPDHRTLPKSKSSTLRSKITSGFSHLGRGKSASALVTNHAVTAVTSNGGSKSLNSVGGSDESSAAESNSDFRPER